MRTVQAQYGQRLERLDEQIAQLSSELYAKPFEASVGDAATGDSPYDAFEEIFRGSEERVRDLLEPYVPLLRDHGPVLDVGCGRGELLELLQEAGVEARGVDVDDGMVARCRRKGLDVELADAVAYLERQEPASLGAIVASHVIEHLPYEELQRLFELARRSLAPGGAPRRRDHQRARALGVQDLLDRPEPPRADLPRGRARARDDSRLRSSAEIIFPRGGGDPEVDVDEATEYALVARTG